MKLKSKKGFKREALNAWPSALLSEQNGYFKDVNYGSTTSMQPPDSLLLYISHRDREDDCEDRGFSGRHRIR